MEKRKTVLYQINPHMFTPQGTLTEAIKLLPHIASIGVNFVYLFSICKADASQDRSFWSPRQLQSRLDNPKNPYRIEDYYEIDEDYGGNSALKAFVQAAHKQNLKVMLDVVYMHCAPNTKVLREIPDCVQRDENGEIIYSEFNFPYFDFNNPKLRAYLIDNMRYYVQEFDVDGYRCDMGDYVPFDFWEEATIALRKIKPDIFMLNEGRETSYVASGVFDCNYNLPALVFIDQDLQNVVSEPYKVFAGKAMDECLKEHYKLPTENGLRQRGIWFVENHDTVTDIGRADLRFGTWTCDCLYVYIFTVGGVPMIYCGEEIADTNAHSLFANKEHNRGYGIDWSNALLKDGKRRLALIKKLSALYKKEDAFSYGDFAWLESARGTLAYKRTYNGECISVYIRFEKGWDKISQEGEILLSRGYKDGSLRKNGFVILKKKI